MKEEVRRKGKETKGDERKEKGKTQGWRMSEKLSKFAEYHDLF